ncbi:MAG: hypothetical protein IJJ40_03150 [Clostridia bacterium]|nr:hypothetical protein [Clostridia bacterium]MBR3145628.1 hypothetical protein [Clostridia bacterium]
MAAFFNKNTIKSCKWCVHGINSEYTDDIFCKKRGVVNNDVCRKYKYNPLKRTPEKTEISKNYSKEDFSL